MHPPIRIHPDHAKVFAFRGRPTVLVTACEHYGGVMNRPFDYERHLTDCQALGINYTRLFTLFRELQSAANPYSRYRWRIPWSICADRNVPVNSTDSHVAGCPLGVTLWRGTSLRPGGTRALVHEGGQSAANPYSTCKPESTDYVAPWERTGTGRALDLQARYDLERWSPEFLERLHGFLTCASPTATTGSPASIRSPVCRRPGSRSG